MKAIMSTRSYCMNNKSSLRGAKRHGNPEKIIKNAMHFTGLLRQLFHNFLAMMNRNDPCNNVFVGITLLLTLTSFSLTSYGKPKIITSITPIASLAAMVLKDKADIESLAVGNGCPHHYNLKPSDLKKVKNADIAIYIDEKFDGFAEKLFDNYSKNVIKLSDIKDLKIIGNNNEKNWHIWLNLDNPETILQELAKIFSKKFPDLKQDINNNFEIALRELTALQETKNNTLANLKDVILLNDSSEYFFASPNIKTIKLYSGTQKSLKYFSKLEELIKGSNNKCLILSLEQNPELYNKLGAKVIMLNSENWEIQNIDSNSFRNQYLDMINQVKGCLSTL